MDGSPWGLAGTVKWRIATSVALGIAITAGYVLQGLFLSFALAALFAGAPFADAARWIVAFGVVVIVRGFVFWAAEIASQATARETKARLRGRLLAQLVDLGPGVLARRATGDLQTAVVAGVEALESYYSRYLPAVFVAIAGCTGVVACLAWVDWRSALLLAALVLAFPVANHCWLRWRMPKSSGIFAAMGAFGAYLLDSLQGIVTLKAFDATAARRTQLAQRAAALRQAAMGDLSVTLARAGITGLITLGGIAIVLGVNAWRTVSGTLAPVALLMTLFLAREAFRPLERLEHEFHTAWSASGAAAPIAALLASEPAVREPAQPVAAPEAADITFENVTFSYRDDETPALANVSFRVPEKSFVALVGPSGAGKSTVVALLLRLFDPAAGRIRIGGTDIRDLPLATLRSLVSVVSQETFLFHGTIADNLRIAAPEATDEALADAARAANLHDFIASLPQGYATPVGERGSQLSGGQRQRLAIARALLKNAPILLLDEATSSVDTRSERLIQAALETLARRRTTLVIAHRLSTVRNADRIVVLDEGRVVEQGDHASLARDGQLYARLVQTQGEAA